MRAPKTLKLLLVALVAVGAWAAVAANLGPDDRQVSITGAPGTNETDAVSPAIAFDENNQRYLLVWSADEVDGEFRIKGQLLTGAAGAPFGPAFDIGSAPAGSDQRQPVVAFSPDTQQYLVVWSGDGLNAGAFEIMGQLVNADGQLVDSVQRYSDMGSNDADPAFDAVTPDVAWHPDLNVFTVVWAADDDLGLLSDGRFEVYGQLVDDLLGYQTGTNDFRITFSLSDDQLNDVLEPSVAALPGTDRWFMAFEGDIQDDGIHDPEVWVYGCTNDVPDPAAFQLSLMGGGYIDGFSGCNPDLAFAPSSGEFICVWDGEENSPNSPAVFGQRFLPDETLVGGMINFSTGAGTPWGDLREATHPSITIDPVTDEWFIAWRGDLNDGIPHHDHEIWARRFDDTGNPVDAAAFMLSSMDPSLGPVAGSGSPVVAVNSIHGYKMIAWSGDLDTTPGDEFEIFTQAWSDGALSAVDDIPMASFGLHGAAPNPFNPMTTIAFDLPSSVPVSLKVYDASGRLVRTLMAEEPGLAGRNEVIWNGRDDSGRQAASGVYLYLLEAGTNRGRGRMTLVK